VQERRDVVGINSSIFMNPRVWEASGHTSGFSDPLVECKSNNKRFRADHLLEEIGVPADEKMSEEELNSLFIKHKDKIQCPECPNKDFTDVKKFNLLVESNLGNFTAVDKEPVYLRGETAQGIYVNFKSVLNTTNMQIPFGIAQIGKAFRNEITPRQFLLRTREFEQMEMQYFTRPEEADVAYDALLEYRLSALYDLGIKKENLRVKSHDNLIFYAKIANDIEYKYPGFGWKELEGIHHRGDYDLSCHSKGSGEDMSSFDEEKKEKFIPNVVESSIGVGRIFFAVLAEAYDEDKINNEMRTVLRLPRGIAPIKIAVLPLSKKEELIAGAKKVFDTLKIDYMCAYDETQSIGRRYRRQDEIGTPYCVTFDFDSLSDAQVTVRDRDSIKQERIAIGELKSYFSEKFIK
jgi:glycyl-tRNA synthetase